MGRSATAAVDGEHYRLAGAQPGPPPAHRIGLWLGAYRPRMLRLTGRLADGWLPSMGYLDLADAPAGHPAIDEAARRAGREPADVRRILNAGVTGDPGEALHGADLVALAAGSILFLLGHVAFRLRMVGTLSRKRVTAAVLVAVAALLGNALPALATWAIVLSILVALAVAETRGRIRTAGRRRGSGVRADAAEARAPR